EGRFDWDPTLDDVREGPLQDAAAVVGYATERYVAWQDWLMEREDGLVDRDPEGESPRGTVTYGNLLDSQRWHAAFHYRQQGSFRESRGPALPAALSLASLRDLDLPAEIF